MKQYEVSKKTYDFMRNKSKESYFNLFDDWCDMESDELYEVLNKLSKVSMYNVTELLVELIRDEAILVEKKPKKYRVILDGVHFSGSCMHWKFTYFDYYNSIETTDSLEEVAIFGEEELKALPQWAQDLAKEV